jgi:hypothetical protein
MSNRKTVTLTKAMSETVSRLANHWRVNESEAMRRLFGLGNFVAEELEKGHTLLVQSSDDGAPERLVFTDLQ